MGKRGGDGRDAAGSLRQKPLQEGKRSSRTRGTRRRLSQTTQFRGPRRAPKVKTPMIGRESARYPSRARETAARLGGPVRSPSGRAAPVRREAHSTWAYASKKPRWRGQATSSGVYGAGRKKGNFRAGGKSVIGAPVRPETRGVRQTCSPEGGDAAETRARLSGDEHSARHGRGRVCSTTTKIT